MIMKKYAKDWKSACEVHFSSLLSHADSFSLSSKKMSSTQEYAIIVKVKRQSLFEDVVPPLDWLRQNQMTQGVKENIRRCAPEFSHGPWGEKVSAGVAQRAHLVPFSFRCCMEWLCLLIPFVFIAALSDDERETLCHCMVLGLYATKRFLFSGFLHSRVNFFPLRCQEKTLLLNPSIIFFPMLSPSDILFWNGEPYRCLIVGSSYHTMMMAGFRYVPPGRSQAKRLQNRIRFASWKRSIQMSPKHSKASSRCC
jgi:hypothetical protein